jgi:probable HAF family extracellular repeat protein
MPIRPLPRVVTALLLALALTWPATQQAKAGNFILEQKLDNGCVAAVIGLIVGPLGNPPFYFINPFAPGQAGSPLLAGALVTAEIVQDCAYYTYVQAAGFSATSGSNDPDAIIPPLGSDPSNTNAAAAVGYDTQGIVAGFSQTDAGPYHAFQWTPSGGTVDLGGVGVYPGTSGVQSMGFGMAADGSVVVGESTSTTSIQTAFRWTASDSTMRDLGSLAGPSGQAIAFATDLNDGSVVVGQTNVPSINPVQRLSGP